MRAELLARLSLGPPWRRCAMLRPEDRDGEVLVVERPNRAKAPAVTRSRRMNAGEAIRPPGKRAFHTP